MSKAESQFSNSNGHTVDPAECTGSPGGPVTTCGGKKLLDVL
jgi:hypothetical protein